ncbi:AAA family ATPase [Sulfidibacter corallicola]|uniref:AAA family ATPase n=1 Tax=Sulfidibacter corallicola TaxID=2818388 RepID=A0A8A4THY8_SULCO|nr:AAA family ATPase [Sulfidibacter corallicola]
MYRGRRLRDHVPIICKVLRDPNPNQGQIAAFRREYERTRDLGFEGVPNALEFLHAADTWAMMLEDVGAKSLSQLNLAGKLSIETFLEMAIRLTEVLFKIHQKFLIHKDLNPVNIVLNPETDQLQIIDFGIATELSRENTSFRDPELLEGTLLYMSPEQTGRMNRSMDYRSDFYSLGATFYELLTGHPPFRANDPLELVHCHIAMTPVPPLRHDSEIPRPVSDIVLKLLAKEAEDRYQSAQGLAEDLGVCLRQWREYGAIQPFDLGLNDHSDRFQLPQKMYGREEEVAELIQAFERTARGKEEVMMVSGFSGIGKSTLIQEIHRPITARRGFFVSGKFDKLKREVPYASLFPPFRLLVRQLLTREERDRERWRQILREALGNNAGLLLEVIPELVHLIGRQASPPSLPPAEAQNRFQLVFQDFIRAFSGFDNPLVLFLDDLQWADTATLDLLCSLMNGRCDDCLFLIGAFRAEEVDGGHPLQNMIDKIRNAGVPVRHLLLKPLSEEDVAQEIADTLHQDIDSVFPLARLVHGKTGGNPFFVGQFLNSLYFKECIRYDHGSRCWQWNLDGVKSLDITDNLVHLLVENLGNLPRETLDNLKIAACIGDRFDLSTLAPVTGKAPRTLGVALWQALIDGFLVPLDSGYRSVTAEINGSGDGVSVSYRFVHDRIRQAAYALLPQSERDRVHLTVGRQFLTRRYSEEDLFDIVNHLNRGRHLIEDDTEKVRLSQLNMAAARKAKLSTAWEPAYLYLRHGIEILESSADDQDKLWLSHYDLFLELHLHAAEMACLLGDYDHQERLTALVLTHARDIRVKVWIQEGIMNAHYARGNYFECFDIGLSVLAMLDLDLPRDPGAEDIYAAMAKTEKLVAAQNLDELTNRPASEDALALVAIRILNNLIGVTWKIKNHMFPLLVCRLVEHCLRYGNAPSSPFIFANYGVVAGLNGDLQKSVRFGHVSLDMLQHYASPELKAKTYMMVYFCLLHWEKPLRDLLPYFIDAYQAGLEAGDLEWGSYALANYVLLMETSGWNLVELERELVRYQHAIERMRQESAIGWYQILHQAVFNLTNNVEDPCLLVGDMYDERDRLGRHKEIQDNGSLYAFYRIKLMLLLQFGRYDEAAEHLPGLEASWAVGMGTAFEVQSTFFAALVRIYRAEHLVGAERQEEIALVESYRDRIAERGIVSEANVLHRLLLVNAELARLNGHHGNARELYDQAIDQARRQSYLNDATMACEMAGRYYLSRDNRRLGRYYIEDARAICRDWGNTAKMRDLERRYPHVLSHMEYILPGTNPRGTIRQTAANLDLTSVLQASQAISGEIRLDQLGSRLIKILIQSAGAQRGVLLLKEREHWLVEVEGRIEQSGVTVRRVGLHLEDYERVPLSLINYLIMTKETVMLNEGPGELFREDPYFHTIEPRSMLCMPIIKQGNLRGLLYLEHADSSEVFTNDRMEVLHLLSAQTAISVENAELYANLEHLVQERTLQLNKKSSDLMSSLRYAVRIQQAMLPVAGSLKQAFDEHVLFFSPRDVVSGDFYWFHGVGDRVFLAVVDCTGHGIPGAFMSMIGYTLLNKIVRETGITDPGEILAELHVGVRQALRQEVEKNNLNDGMEVCFCRIDRDTKRLVFAGAGRPLYMVRSKAEQNEFVSIKGSRKLIGGRQKEKRRTFETHELEFGKGDMLYMVTDGFMDQGDAAGKKYGSRRFKGLLQEMARLRAGEQKRMLQVELNEHQGAQSQRDDMTILGVRL